MKEIGTVEGKGGRGEEAKEREEKNVEGEKRKWNKRGLSKLKLQQVQISSLL
jgi:hypothetical protein